MTRHLPPVLASPERVLRVAAGLRPFRRSGFVVRADQLGQKLLIHNYGHGGAGVTLSWGTARMAVELALKARAGDCAIIGCGAVGLATARLLQERGVHVTIYAKDLPPVTTSDVAAALWFPVSIYDEADPEAVTPEFRQQLHEVCRVSHSAFRTMAGERYGIRWIRTYFLYTDQGDGSMFHGGDDLYPERRWEQGSILTAPYAESFMGLLIETPVYLRAVVRDVETAGGRIIQREVRDAAEVTSLPEPVVINCAGLGSRDLFRDREMVPIRGQVVILQPQPEIDYAYVQLAPGNLLYMFPRRDGVLLGGTYDEGSESTAPTAEQTTRILREHAALHR